MHDGNANHIGSVFGACPERFLGAHAVECREEHGIDLGLESCHALCVRCHQQREVLDAAHEIARVEILLVATRHAKRVHIHAMGILAGR
jgi:hypothetical protein